jgi:hypothetical protein
MFLLTDLAERGPSSGNAIESRHKFQTRRCPEYTPGRLFQTPGCISCRAIIVTIVKFVEHDSFREVPRLPGESERVVRIGELVLRGGEQWRIVGITAHPSRPSMQLVFVERASLEPA